jgi:hypothetical protein
MAIFVHHITAIMLARASITPVMAPSTTMTKPKGMKDRKKADKQKALAKRAAAAAEQSKSKKEFKALKKIEAAVVEELVMENLAQKATASVTKEVCQERPAIDIVLSADLVEACKTVMVDHDIGKYKSGTLHCDTILT